MSVRRISAIFRRDLKSGTREFLLLYMMLAPVLLAVLFRFFIPSVNTISYTFAVEETLGEEVIDEFDKYGTVELMEDRAAVEDRVLRIDDVVGIVRNAQGEIAILLEGNETGALEYVAREIVYELNNEGAGELVFSTSDIGRGRSPLLVYGAVGMIIMAITIGGMIIGLNIIEEKEAGTISALSASPMRKWEFIVGKSLVGLVFPIIHTFVILLLFGVTWVDPWKVIFLTLVSSLLAVVLGFLIGVLSGNQLAAIANMKGLFVIVSGSFLGYILLAESRHFFLYWSPVYWSIKGFYQMVTSQISWTVLGQYSLWIIALTAIVFVLASGKIRRGLS